MNTARNAAPAPPQAGLPGLPDALQEQEAFAIGYQAYLWGYPYVKSLLLRREATHPSSRNHAPYNQFHRYTELAKPGFHDFTPTVEALMNVGWFDLSGGPLLIDVPEVLERYWSVVATDIAGNTVSYLGSRLGSAPGRYAYVWRGWAGVLPAGVTRIDIASRFLITLVRCLVCQGREGDLQVCVASNARFTLQTLPGASNTPLEAGPTPPLSARPDASHFHSLAFFDLLNAAMAEAGVLPGEEGVAAQFHGLGIACAERFDAERLSDAQRRGLQQGVQAAFGRVQAHLQVSAQRQGTWFFNYKVGVYGHDFLSRAAIALGGFGAMVPEETLYVYAMTDDQGAPLDAARRYRIRFDNGGYPPVDAFWSITLYTRPGNQLVANPIDRYSISSETTGLQHGDDGSLTIALQSDAPEGELAANWLPTPASGPFWLVLRTYVPHAPLLQGHYTPPPVTRAD